MAGPVPSSVLDLVPAAVAEVTGEGGLEARNAAMTGLLAAMGGGRNLGGLPLAAEERERLLRGGPVRLSLAQGEARYWRLSLAPAGDRRWLIAVDETETEKLRVCIAAGARVRALAGLAGDIAHELSNHLVAATGLADNAKDRAPPEERELMSRLLAGMHRGASLVRALAVMLRRGPRRRQVVALPELVRDTVALLGNHLRSLVEVTAGPEAPDVRVEASEAMQTLLALLHRARATAPAGTGIRVEVAADREAAEAGGPARPVGCVRIGDAGDAAAFDAGDGDAEESVALARLWLVRHGGSLAVAPQEGGGRVIEARLPAVGR